MASFAPPGDQFTPAPRDAWLPQVRTGFFYKDDRQYYLYADKRTLTLQEAQGLVFELSDAPIPETVSVRVEGVPFTNFRVEGRELLILTDDQESFAALHTLLEYDLTQWDFIAHGFAFGPSNEVEVTYDVLTWVETTAFPEPTGTNQYTQATVIETFLIKEADRIEYRLHQRNTTILPTALGDPLAAPTGWVDDPPADRAPTVITDDSLEYHNPINYQVEFHVDPITGEAIFNASRNLLQNPSFEIGSTALPVGVPGYRYPLEWRVSNPAQTPSIQGTAYHGDFCYSIQGTGVISQTVRIDPRQHYTTSIWITEGTGEVCVSFLDIDGFYLDPTGGPTPTAQPDDDYCAISAITGVPLDVGTWVRTSITLGDTVVACDAPDEFFPIPSAAEFVEVKYRRVSGRPCFDAAQFIEGIVPEQFFSFDPNITIEYETSEAGHFLPTVRDLLIPQLSDPDLNPISNPFAGGFLFFEEFSNVDDYQLGKGSIGPTPVASPTAVLDYTGVVDVDVGRVHLPYAKVSGWTKLRERRHFHLVNPAPVHDISDIDIENGSPSPVPADIEWIIAEGLQAEGADAVLVVVPDSRIPVRIDAYVYDRWENPAFMFRGAASATGAVFPDDPVTSHAGQIALEYTPPDVTGFGDLGVVDTIRLTIGTVTKTLKVKGFRQSGLDYDAFLTV